MQQAVRDAVNISGSLSARTVSGHSGSIVLGGDAGGNVVVSGTLSATGGKRSKGGAITITGRNIGLRGATVDVSGGTGGGTVLIGGRPRGERGLLSAETTTVDQNSTIKADATVAGNGGNVTVWADGTTTFGGFITARGGPQHGDGGQAEVSGKTTLHLTGDYRKTPLANLSAKNGNAGTILFDPGTINIIDQASLSGNQALNGPDTFTAQFISSQLASANVSIDTNDATGANGTAGDINLMSGAQISWSGNNKLTLNAARDINFAAGASITGTGAGAESDAARRFGRRWNWYRQFRRRLSGEPGIRQRRSLLQPGLQSDRRQWRNECGLRDRQRDKLYWHTGRGNLVEFCERRDVQAMDAGQQCL